MEKIVLKAIAAENAMAKLSAKVLVLQSAINQAANVEEVSKIYSDIVFECQVVGRMLADVRSGCFSAAAGYHSTYDV